MWWWWWNNYRTAFNHVTAAFVLVLDFFLLDHDRLFGGYNHMFCRWRRNDYDLR